MNETSLWRRIKAMFVPTEGERIVIVPPPEPPAEPERPAKPQANYAEAIAAYHSAKERMNAALEALNLPDDPWRTKLWQDGWWRVERAGKHCEPPMWDFLRSGYACWGLSSIYALEHNADAVALYDEYEPRPTITWTAIERKFNTEAEAKRTLAELKQLDTSQTPNTIS